MRIDLFSLCRSFINGLCFSLASLLYMFFAYLCFAYNVPALGVVFVVLYLAFLFFSVFYVTLRYLQYYKELNRLKRQSFKDSDMGD